MTAPENYGQWVAVAVVVVAVAVTDAREWLRGLWAGLWVAFATPPIPGGLFIDWPVQSGFGRP